VRFTGHFIIYNFVLFEPPSFGISLSIRLHVAGNGAVANFVGVRFDNLGEHGN
jgi:hypothetical protein